VLGHNDVGHHAAVQLADDRSVVFSKETDLIDSAKHELYLSLFSESWEQLKRHIENAVKRGVDLSGLAEFAVPLADFPYT